MDQQLRAVAAAAAHALIIGRKVAGVYDHARGRHLRIAAEAQGIHLQGFDGERMTKFGGTVPELYDAGTGTYLSVELADGGARGFDRASGHAWSAQVGDRLVQLYDHGAGAWFAFDLTLA